MSRWPPPPSADTAFYKAHGLGNDYLVFEEGDAWTLTPERVARICDPHRGVGSDGIVVLLRDRSGGVYRARMFNPDGSEFERSGNGLRVLAGYLTRGAPGRDEFPVEVGGRRVTLHVHGREAARVDVSVDMGRAETGPAAIAMDPEALDREGIMVGPDGDLLAVVPVSVGNPHLVVSCDELSEEGLRRIGAYLVAHPALEHGANVQLASRAAPGVVRALVWERGVGPTSASGTSACAVAVAAVVRGWEPPSELRVEMPGGALTVAVSAELDLRLRGPVEEVCTGTLLDLMKTAP
ncbi:MAG: diaminopimelate epimerase [Gemmatimonadota bacterium]|nr:diaminopimelate epimerase [Gemmatimonadota bacterium]